MFIECNPFGFCLTLREDWVTWEKAYGRNRSFRKKYLDLIAAVKTTAAKDPSISSLIAPGDLSGGSVKL